MNNLNNGEEKIIDYSYKNFKGENIILMKHKPKTYFKENGENGSYNEVPILCSHGEPGNLYTGRGWMIEYCPVWSDGLRVDEKEYTKKDDKNNIVKHTIATYQAKITFDRREKDHMELASKLDEGHLAIARALIDKNMIYDLKVDGLNATTNKLAHGTGLRRLVHYPLDQGKDMEGVGLSQFVKLRGTPKSDRHTTFIDLKGREIPWAELINCDFFWQPLVVFTHIYSSGNGKLSVQSKVESGIVIKRKPRGGAEKQKNSLKFLQNIYPAEMDALPSQDYTLKENSNSTATDKPKEEKIHQPAPLNELHKMASGGQYSPPVENQEGSHTDAQGKPAITNLVPQAGQYIQPTASQNTIQPPLVPQNNIQPATISQNGAPQYIQPTIIPQNNIQPVTIPQNSAPQYNQPTIIPQNNIQPPIIPQNNIQPPLIPQNSVPQYNQPAVIPGAITGVPSVGIPQINQQLQTFQG